MVWSGCPVGLCSRSVFVVCLVVFVGVDGMVYGFGPCGSVVLFGSWDGSILGVFWWTDVRLVYGGVVCERIYFSWDMCLCWFHVYHGLNPVRSGSWML